MKRFLLIITALVAISGCENFNPGLFGKTTGQVVIADQVYKTGLPYLQMTSVLLTAEELAVIDQAKMAYEQFGDKWEIALVNPEYLSTRLITFRSDWQKLKAQYAAVRQVALDNQESYADDVWLTLGTYNDQLTSIGANVDEMLEGNSLNDVALTALQYVTLAAHLELI